MAILSPRRRRSIEAFIVVMMMSSCVTIMLTRMLIPVFTGNPMPEDKTLEMMLNVWFATGFVTTMQFFFGSSQGSRDKDEAKEELDATVARNPPPVVVAAPVPPAADPAPAPLAAPPAPPAGGPFRTTGAELRPPRIIPDGPARPRTDARTSDADVLEPAAPNPPR